MKNYNKLFILLTFVSLYLFSVNFVFAGDEIPIPTINVSPDIYYPLDETLYLEGRSDPSAKIEVLFERQTSGAQPVRLVTQANFNGEWFVAQSVELPSGEWTVRARALQAARFSDWSNPRIIRSIVSGFIFGSVKIKYLPITVTITLLFLASIALLVYLLRKVKKFKESVHLRRDITDELEHLERAIKDGQGGGVTRENKATGRTFARTSSC